MLPHISLVPYDAPHCASATQLPLNLNSDRLKVKGLEQIML